MAYSSFQLPIVVNEFNLDLDETVDLFAEIEEISPSEVLTITLKEAIPLSSAINTKKER